MQRRKVSKKSSISLVQRRATLAAKIRESDRRVSFLSIILSSEEIKPFLVKWELNRSSSAWSSIRLQGRGAAAGASLENSWEGCAGVAVTVVVVVVTAACGAGGCGTGAGAGSTGVEKTGDSLASGQVAVAAGGGAAEDGSARCLVHDRAVSSNSLLLVWNCLAATWKVRFGRLPNQEDPRGLESKVAT